MKYILFASLFIFTSCLQTQTECNCQDFKTGKYVFEQEIDGKKIKSTFERTEKIQIETFQGKTDTATVRWINDCEFILQKKHPKNQAERKAISMKIIATENNSYTFEYNFVGDDNKKTGTVTKQ